MTTLVPRPAPTSPADALSPPDADGAADESRREVVVVNRLPAGDVARGTLTVVAVLVGLYLLWRVQEVVLIMFLAIMLATAIEPVVNRLRRGPFTRGSGTLVVYTVIVAAIGVPAYLLIPGVVSQAGGFAASMPERLQSLKSYAYDLQPYAVQQIALNALDRATAALSNPNAPAGDAIVQAGATAAYTMLGFVSIFVLAFYWMVERASIKRVVLRAVPVRHARSVNLVWMEVEEKLGGWVRGQLLLMLAVGVMAGLGYAVIGLPNAALLGVAAGLFEIVPMIGPFLSFAPAVLVALALDPTRALVVLVYAIVVQQIESNILVPRVMGQSVGISPLTVLLGILVGSTLYGLPGAFVAVPVAAAAQVIVSHVLHTEEPEQAEIHAEAPGGTPPPEAVRHAERVKSAA